MLSKQYSQNADRIFFSKKRKRFPKNPAYWSCLRQSIVAIILSINASLNYGFLIHVFYFKHPQRKRSGRLRSGDRADLFQTNRKIQINKFTTLFYIFYCIFFDILLLIIIITIINIIINNLKNK